MESRELVYAGARARAFKESEPYQEAFKRVERNIIEAFLMSSDQGAELRELLFARYQALLAIDGQLQNAIDDGDLAKLETLDE